MRLYEEWTQRYSAVFRVPAPLGSTRVVLTDPKAVAQFYSVETWTYVQTMFFLFRVAIESMRMVTWPWNRRHMAQLGRGLLWAEGEAHKRQRKAISPVLSNTVEIKRLISVFYDSDAPHAGYGSL
ncbi:hypothetical protein C8Q80DRAFT_1268958 [Daedaleopsis nitida]|nr:hypothetical protein C8Q80DRAFT_1268958 [Daedaleopsis nitida]